MIAYLTVSPFLKFSMERDTVDSSGFVVVSSIFVGFINYSTYQQIYIHFRLPELNINIAMHIKLLKAIYFNCMK